MSDAVYEQLQKIFQTVLSEEQFEAFHPGATMDEIEGWDSMTFLEIIMGLEGEFGIRIDGLDAANMITVPNILAYLRNET
jgi:acyl carrier protein